MDAAILAEHKRNNHWQSTLLLLAVGVVLFAIAYSLFGWTAGWIAIVVAVVLFIATPAVSPKIVLRMYRARPLGEREAPELMHLLAILSDRANLPTIPALHYLPSDVMNAFTVGRPKKSAIAVSDGLLRRLTYAELAAVLAHEVAHIQNHDVRLMGFADIAGRLVGSLSSLGKFFLILNLPLILIGQSHIPWFTVLILITAPMLTTLAQMALSRTREFAADAGATELIGDPGPLADALSKIEHHSRTLREKVLGGRRGLPEPSLLRTHPKTEERIARLRALRPQTMPPIESEEHPTLQAIPQAFPQLEAKVPQQASSQALAQTPIAPRWHRTGTWF